MVVVAGGLVALDLGADSPPVSGPTTATTPTPKTPVRLTAGEVAVAAGPVSTADAQALARACVTQEGRPAGKVGRITHRVQVLSWADRRKTQNSVVVQDTSDGLIYGCVGFPDTKVRNGIAVQGVEVSLIGGDAAEARKRKSVINPTDATHPAVPTDGGSSRYFIRFDTQPDLLTTEAWYRVDARVVVMRQRFVVKGAPGPWFVAKPIDGYVFLRSRDKSTALRQGDQVRLETQVIGRGGKLLDAPADQKGGGGLTPSPGTTRVDTGTVGLTPDGRAGWLNFTNR